MRAKEPEENAKRLEILRNFHVLDTGSEQIYDDVTRLTADLCDVPVCLISLVESDRQWFKSEVGLGVSETTIEQSICSHAIAADDFLEIEDTHKDRRTADNPLCLGKKPFRFYAGALLRTLDSWPLGTLCVLDYKPRSLTPLQRRILTTHANYVARQLELTRLLVQIAKDGNTYASDLIAIQTRKDLTRGAQERYDTLTPREKEIMHLIAGRSGNPSSKQIAKELGISHRTVDHHRASILAKMKVGSVAELIAISLKTGILRQDR